MAAFYYPLSNLIFHFISSPCTFFWNQHRSCNSLSKMIDFRFPPEYRQNAFQPPSEKSMPWHTKIPFHRALCSTIQTTFNSSLFRKRSKSQRNSRLAYTYEHTLLLRRICFNFLTPKSSIFHLGHQYALSSTKIDQKFGRVLFPAEYLRILMQFYPISWQGLSTACKFQSRCSLHCL